MMDTKDDSIALMLRQKALELGASDAKIISADRIPIEDEVMEMCKPPFCEGYGKSVNCPPHAMRPEQARDLIRHFRTALVFKIDVHPETLLGANRFKTFKKIYIIVSKLEALSIEQGFTRSKGLAAGSCKPVFCKDVPCEALNDEGECRYPSLGRPSMEAVGINVFKLVKDLGWEIYPILKETDPEAVPMGMLAGLLLMT